MHNKHSKELLLLTFFDSRESLSAMLMARLNNKNDVEDILQDIFLRIDNIPHHSTISNPRAYLWRMATNAAVDRERENQKRCRIFKTDTTALERSPNASATPEDHAQVRSCIQEMQRVLRELNPTCRRAYLLSRRDGLDYKEIASIMGVSPHMVKKHMVHALGALRLALLP